MKTHLVMAGLIVIIVATFSFSVIKGNELGKGFYNLSSSSLGVSVVNNVGSDVECLPPVNCGSIGRIIGFSGSKTSRAEAETAANADCNVEVEKAKKQAGECVSKAIANCVSIACIPKPISNNQTTTCKVDKCSEYLITQECEDVEEEFDKYGNPIIRPGRSGRCSSDFSIKTHYYCVSTGGKTNEIVQCTKPSEGNANNQDQTSGE